MLTPAADSSEVESNSQELPFKTTGEYNGKLIFRLPDGKEVLEGGSFWVIHGVFGVSLRPIPKGKRATLPPEVLNYGRTEDER